MKLLKYRVKKFRSVEETEWIEVDRCACFVGANESGKTNLLLPLWKFNPAAGATEIDFFRDYPRDEYSKDSESKDEQFIEVLFSLTEDEQKLFQKQLDNDCKRTVAKVKEEEEEADSNPTDSEEEEEADSKNENELKDLKFTQHLLIARHYGGDYSINVSNEKCEYKKRKRPLMSKILRRRILKAIPKFIYYEEYGNLDGNLDLQKVIKDLGSIDKLKGKERMRVRTLKVFFEHLGLDPQEILDLGQDSDSEELYTLVGFAARNISKQFREWWTEEKYKFHFEAKNDRFRIRVSDSKRPVEVGLASRSKGLQWFFSFFLVFLAESKGAHKNCILLLDEPGLHLHPNAQQDLIKFFGKLSDSNQLLYTTHLPFLVDHHNLHRVKAVYTENGLTKASNDLRKGGKDKKPIQPVNAALGIAVSESLLIGCDIVIVEGITDQYYLTAIKDYLIAKELFKLKKTMMFIPVHGVKANIIQPLISILQGRDDNLPVVLLDSDETGKKWVDKLKQNIYKSEQKKVLEFETYTDKKGSEVEDLVPHSWIEENFKDIFNPKYDIDKLIKQKPIDPQRTIVPQLKTFLNEDDKNNKGWWKFEMSKRVEQNFSDNEKDLAGLDLPATWTKLFEALQKHST